LSEVVLEEIPKPQVTSSILCRKNCDHFCDQIKLEKKGTEGKA